jgi:hypothetical protein
MNGGMIGIRRRTDRNGVELKNRCLPTATIVDWRDALYGDNTATSPPTLISK